MRMRTTLTIFSHFAAVTAFLILCVAISQPVPAQCPGTPAQEIVANPNRPTVADPADISQYGVLEVEYGYNHIMYPESKHENNLAGLFKFAATCNLEIRWDTGSFLRQASGGSTVTGFGDQWLGFQYRFHRQSEVAPSLAFSYAFKFPTASATKDLGTGKHDHQLKVLVTKDILGVHFDFNTSYFFFGRPIGGGTDQNVEINLAFSHPVYKKLLFTAEFYGDTTSNINASPSANALWAFTYAVTPRLILDAGMDHGLNSTAAFHRNYFVGMTYSIADLYHWRRRGRP